MLVTFTCEAHGDITMFGDVAEHFIKLMGHSGAIPGAIAAKDIPASLERLQKAIEESKEEEIDDEAKDNDEDEEDDEPRTTLAVRAFPLIEMLTAAADAECSIMWYRN